ncbi:MAG: DNA translocase FtsK [Lachnospiraceae bacterium]
MAGTKKNSTGNSKNKRSGASGRSRSRGKSKSPAKTSGGIRSDILVLTVLVISILLFISNFNFSGSVGRIVGGFTKGLFGIMSYVFPFVLFFGFSFYTVNKGNYLIRRKCIGLFLTFVFVCALFQLLIAGVDKNDTIASFYTAAADGYISGGLLGGIVVFLFSKPFSTAGAYIFTFAGLILSIIILTQKPILKNFHSFSSKKLSDANIRRKERAEELRLIREENRKIDEERRSMMLLDEDDLEENMTLSSGKSPSVRKNSGSTPARKKPARANYREITSIDLKEILNPDEIKGINKTADTKNVPDIDLREMSVLERAEQNAAMEAAAKEMSVISQPEEHEETVPTIQLNDYTENEPAGFEERIGMTGIHGVTELRFDDNLDIVENDPEISPERNAVKKVRRTVKDASSGKETENKAADVENEINEAAPEPKEYVLPSTKMLTKMKLSSGDSQEYLLEMAEKLRKTLQDFGVNVKITNVSRGPAVTRYELEPEHGVKVSKIVGLTDDIKLNLAAADIRMEAPIPGKAAIGIEVPNKENTAVPLRDIVESPEFKNAKSKMSFAVGRDIAGKPVVADIRKMPHLLIAGATGSGKSVCINSLIMSILFHAKPDEIRMIMIDPKVIELSIYNGIPHLLLPVVTDPKKAAGALNWAVREMTDRYQKFAKYVGIRDLTGYNAHIKKLQKDLTLSEEERAELKVLPNILIIVDELADLMMVAPGDVEQSICRLTQLARACGIHLVVATQRPSVNVITGLIKANMPSRIAFAVSSGVDSRTILDMNGAERLLGKGDMLFYPQGYPKPVRIQGTFVSDEDVAKVVDFIKSQNDEEGYDEKVADAITSASSESGEPSNTSSDDRDEYFWDAAKIIIDKDKASIGMLQRVLKIGFNRAARIMDQLCEEGIVGPEEGTKARQILISPEEFESRYEEEA